MRGNFLWPLMPAILAAVGCAAIGSQGPAFDGVEQELRTGGLVARIRNPPESAVAGAPLVVWLEVCSGKAATLVGDSDKIGYAFEFEDGIGTSLMFPPGGRCDGRHLILPGQCLVSPVELRVSRERRIDKSMSVKVFLTFWWRLLDAEGNCLDESVDGEASWKLTVHPAGESPVNGGTPPDP